MAQGSVRNLAANAPGDRRNAFKRNKQRTAAPTGALIAELIVAQTGQTDERTGALIVATTGRIEEPTVARIALTGAQTDAQTAGRTGVRIAVRTAEQIVGQTVGPTGAPIAELTVAQTGVLTVEQTGVLIAEPIIGATTTTTSVATTVPANTIIPAIIVVDTTATATVQATDMAITAHSTAFSIIIRALTPSGGSMSAMDGTIIRSTISAIVMWCRSGFTGTDAVIGKLHCFAMTHMDTATSSGAAAGSITAING